MSASAASKGPLIVRLCNWVGEAVLSLPTLTMLSEQGYELHLIGKRWAVNLFEGHGWNVHVRPAGRSEAITQLKTLRQQLSAQYRGFTKHPNYLLFTSSFSSALEGRMAGLKPIGYRKEGRGLLLNHGVPFKHGMHAADNYWRLAADFARVSQQRPVRLGLKPSTTHRDRAHALMQAHGLVTGRFIMLCPFSGAADATGKKLWPAFPELGQTLLAQGWQVVLCPGPGEEPQALANYPRALNLEGVDLGTYAALSQQAACTVSNDTGPGHLAAAAGGRVVSVLGPDAAPMWWVQGEQVTVLRRSQGWPDLQEVLETIDQGTHPA